MKLIIFGSSGTVGRQLLLQALQSGYSVTAFTRSKERLSDIMHPHLRIVEGDVLNEKDVLLNMKGHDAVLCALGDGRKGIVRSQGTKNILKAMKEAGIDRFVCQTTLGAGDSRGNLNFFWKHIMFGWFLKEAYRDHELQEEHILQSKLNWTIVRPGAFTNGNVTGNYQHGFAGNEKNLKLKISRADLADFMLKQLNTDEYSRKAASLSY
ncbi:MAG TPA: SDR family oxidoreductase [Chitinophagaceae bacterium]